jgi:hypothetical protein
LPDAPQTGDLYAQIRVGQLRSAQDEVALAVWKGLKIGL